MDPVRSNNGPRYKHLADEAAPYDTITVDKLTPIIGGEIGGVDLSKSLGNRTFDEIHRAENSIAFWDNRCVQHHAMWDYWPHTRSGHCVTVKGERPFYRA